VALDWRRERQLTPQHVELHEGVASAASPQPPSDEHLALADRGRAVSAALDRLSPPQRQALWLFHVEGLSYREIALRLSVPIGTVGTWIVRGREQLSATWAQEDSRG
jgi:RNA polymerase sigma-70 factor (ECF subfamily)